MTKAQTVKVFESDRPLPDRIALHRDAYPGAHILYRQGDYYNSFNSQARALAGALNITLTKRTVAPGHAIHMAGVPYHMLDASLTALEQRGFHVVIVEPVAPSL